MEEILLLILVVFLFMTTRKSGFIDTEILGQNWQVLQGQDFSNGPMKTVMHQTRPQCAQQCMATPGCVGFSRPTMSPDSLGPCSLKSQRGASKSSPDTETYFL
jgi:hypothetical protein